MGGCHFEKMVHVKVPKRYRREIQTFWYKTSELFKIWLSETRSLPFHCWYCWSHEHAHSRETQSPRIVSQSQFLEERKKNDIYIGNAGSGLAFFSTDLRHKIGAMSAMNLEYWEEKDHSSQGLFTTLFAYTLSWYTQSWLSTILLKPKDQFWDQLRFLWKRTCHKRILKNQKTAWKTNFLLWLKLKWWQSYAQKKGALAYIATPTAM